MFTRGSFFGHKILIFVCRIQNGVEKKNITNGLNGHVNGNGHSETNGMELKCTN